MRATSLDSRTHNRTPKNEIIKSPPKPVQRKSACYHEIVIIPSLHLTPMNYSFIVSLVSRHAHHRESFSTICLGSFESDRMLCLLPLVSAVPAVHVGDGIGLVVFWTGFVAPTVPVGEGIGLVVLWTGLGFEGRPGEPSGISGGFECRSGRCDPGENCFLMSGS